MLKSVEIINNSILKNVRVSFDKYLNIITGESGSGKTLFLNSIASISNSKLNKEDFAEPTKPYIEMIFEIKKDDFISNWFTTNNIPLETNIITLNIQKLNTRKSRVLINGSIIGTAEGEKLLDYLVSYNKQHNSLLLKNKTQQTKLYDDIINIEDQLATYRDNYNKYIKISVEYEELKKQGDKLNEESLYFNNLITDFEEINPQPNEAEDLEEKIKKFENLEYNYSNLISLINEVKNNEGSIYEHLNKQINILSSISNDNSELDKYHKRFESSCIEILETTNDIEAYLNNIDFNKEEYERKKERMSSLFTLLKKYNTNSTNRLIDIYNEAKNKLESTQNFSVHVNKLNEELLFYEKKVTDSADLITDKRKTCKELVEQKIKDILSSIGLKNSNININIQTTKLTNYGNSEVEITWDPNNKHIFIPIGKTASGGELNRLFLTLKSLSNEQFNNQTLIFDEIDSGLSGEISIKVAELLSKLSKNNQVICITHQASIASAADKHFLITKSINERTETEIKELSYKEKIGELSNIMSGDRSSNIADKTAEELLNLWK